LVSDQNNKSKHDGATHMITTKRAMLLAALVAGTTGCLSSGGGNSASDNLTGPAADAPGLDRYRATVTRTSFGIPHIEAPDFASMGYAYGYVQAEDNLCLLAEDTLTVRGLRARYLGGEGQYTIPANGAVASNVDADFFWRTAIQK
jgi:acyl-homoserine-lactone acylase